MLHDRPRINSWMLRREEVSKLCVKRQSEWLPDRVNMVGSLHFWRLVIATKHESIKYTTR